jgi:hypothetical protein
VIKQCFHRLLCFFGAGANCNDVATNTYEFAEGTLTERWMRRIRKHLSKCKPCLRFIDSYLATKELGRKAPREDMSVDQKEAILQRLAQ